MFTSNEAPAILTEEKFQDIFINEDFRNSVAFAHIHVTTDRQEFRETCTYPIRYRVTDKQIETAKNELQRAKDELYKNHFNDLIFVCMGMEYAPRYEDDICNHRIRTEFINSLGKRYFIELGTGKYSLLRIDHAVDRDLQEIREAKYWEYSKEYRDKYDKGVHDLKLYELMKEYEKQIYYNYKGLERNTPELKYTKANVLSLVNKQFECNFKNIIISQHTARLEDNNFKCISPKQ